jgi:hypothetical protein
MNPAIVKLQIRHRRVIRLFEAAFLTAFVSTSSETDNAIKGDVAVTSDGGGSIARA